MAYTYLRLGGLTSLYESIVLTFPESLARLVFRGQLES